MNSIPDGSSGRRVSFKLPVGEVESRLDVTPDSQEMKPAKMLATSGKTAEVRRNLDKKWASSDSDQQIKVLMDRVNGPRQRKAETYNQYGKFASFHKTLNKILFHQASSWNTSNSEFKNCEGKLYKCVKDQSYDDLVDPDLTLDETNQKYVNLLIQERNQSLRSRGYVKEDIGNGQFEWRKPIKSIQLIAERDGKVLATVIYSQQKQEMKVFSAQAFQSLVPDPRSKELHAQVSEANRSQDKPVSGESPKLTSILKRSSVKKMELLNLETERIKTLSEKNELKGEMNSLNSKLGEFNRKLKKDEKSLSNYSGFFGGLFRLFGNQIKLQEEILA